MIQPGPEGSTQGYLLVSVEVLRYDKRNKSENIEIVSTEMELMLEQTQQVDGNAETMPSYDAKVISEGKNVNTKFENFETSGTVLYVTLLPKIIAIKAKKVSNSNVNTDRPKSKDTKSKNRVLKNTNAKSSTVHVRKMSRSASIDSNKRETKNSNVFQSNASVLSTKIVNAVNDAKYKNLEAASVVAKSRLSVATTPTATNKNLENDVLLIGSCDSNLHTISILEMAASSPVCLMSRATSTKSWLWHCMLSYLNFGTINQLTSKDLVDGLLKFKYKKDHLCSACEQGKSKKASLPPKLVLSTESKLELLHMDLCGPMRVAQILTIPTDNGTEFKNKKLRAFYAKLGIVHKTLIAHTPHKTPYELIQGCKPNIQYFHVFGSLCYLTNDRDDLGKMKLKANIGIFIGYFKSSRGFRIYNRQTKKIIETIHVKFNELTAMASECNNLEPEISCMNFQDSSEDSQSMPLKIDLDNLFGPLYEEYYEMSSQEVSDNSTANTLDNDNTFSSSSIVVKEDEAP
uniref:Retrovirus-related Pol polyprotein from transposon TNT 1-94 n=1 Tax=Tanacetum cinerariifolium TaxID=118510 RepID=A0A6L2K4N0_TANCI|nr:retrovirus-related Pol polyprotein from transposon TNT 1-94 [Tanacetum cinerariifolium]